MVRSSDLALRAELHTRKDLDGIFVTLTYAPEKEPPNRSLRREDVSDFLDRLRSDRTRRSKKLHRSCLDSHSFKHCPKKLTLKAFGSGEYGDSGNPHYHLIIWGQDLIPDAKSHGRSQGGHPQYISAYLEEKWSHGFCPFGEITPDSIQYAVKYTTSVYKNKNPEKVAAHYRGREKERLISSRGLAANYLKENAENIIARGFTVIRDGKPTRLPRYLKEKLIDYLSDSGRISEYMEFLDKQSEELAQKAPFERIREQRARSVINKTRFALHRRNT